MPNLPNNKTIVSYSGAAVSYTATAAGRLDVKLWGGGGAGLYLPTAASPGGAGGYTIIQSIAIAIGDVVKLEVGQGGQAGTLQSGAQGAYAGTGGLGGWPDGGNGGSGINAIGGGGGGSTRVYLNNVLLGVAAGGGGAGATATNRQAGAGGGTVGQDGTQTLDGTGGNVSGATQSAGGVNSSFPSSVAPFYTGASLQGGHGYPTGTDQTTDGSGSTGSGGGGGFFGGGGAGKPGSYVQGASGGSSFVKAGFVGSTTGGNRGVPGNSTDPDLPTGCAVGATNANTLPQGVAGGNGAAVLNFNPFTIGGNFPIITEFYTGAAQSYTVQTDGIITFEAWGGGGAGGTFFSATTVVGRYGGPGAYLFLKVPVRAGDVIKLEVAQGGQKGTASTDTGPGTSGGLGGWPDGGSAGLSSLYTPKPAFGGGGGSTRIYLNNVLIGLAAGGAGSYGFERGNPGGTIDAVLTNVSNAALTPATHYAGGACTANGGGTSRNFGQGQSFLSSPTGTGGNGFANSANNTTATAGASVGGGGGWWGGGVFYINNDTGMGGGGSSYIHPDYFLGSNWISVAGSATSSAGIGSNKPAGTGDGGLVSTTTTLSGVAAGGNGAVWMSHAAAPAATTLGTNTLLGLERVRRTFNITRTGTVKAKMWGGGGAGGTYFASTLTAKKGGAGGYTEVSIPVVNGDTISVEVGQGGQKSWSSLGAADGANSGLSTTNKPLFGGGAGWPDGGTGGRHGASPWGGFGGGGGSTRVYKNGTLVAVAAGGGGATGNFFGGSGGAIVGGQSADSSFCGSGGTQVGGGLSDGASLKGAPGWTATPDTVETTSGAGGGGGYFGGGSNDGRTVNGYGSGGGGSAYVAATYTGATFSGVRDTGVPYDGTSGDRPAGVAVGGSASTAANTTAALAAMTAGGDGAALVEFPLILLDGVAATAPYIGNIAGLYQVSADGVLNLEAWGAGGGGGYDIGQDFGDGWGGGGGNIAGSFNVFAGDLIKVEVGQGGQGGIVGTAGGLGGWPDGGNGGRSSTLQIGHGGGGGSTRIYLNSVLIAVAGAGGGMFHGGQGGVGGGLTGGTGSNPSGATGGSQTGPGVSTGGTSNAGFLQGGNGYVAGDTNTTADDTSGGGGGGGWFGGGGGIVPARSFAAAGGGSSYVATVGINVATTSATAQNAFDSGHKPAGVGAGGKNNRIQAVGTVCFPGGDGAVYMKLTASTAQATAIFRATGADQTWTSPSYGTLHIRGYAAGGGGGQASNFIDSTHPAGWGGPGGYIEGDLIVAPGDVITIKVGKGGVPGTAASGAFGGWPDGGSSGRFVSGGFLAGSGGGSTRIYKNGVLEMIAGAGGGAVGVTSGGAGGGLTGDTGTGAAPATGGTQSAGGDSPVPTSVTAGSSLQGGSGLNVSITSADDKSGGGGGGGFFGGGGGYAAGLRGIPGAGGGSSSFGPDPFNTLTQKGTTGTGTPFSTTILPPLTAFGGISVNNPGTPKSGNDGFVVFYFSPVSGSLAAGPLPTIQMQAPTGAAGSTVFGALGTVTMTVPSVGVNVGTPIATFTTHIDMTAPTPSPSGGQNWTVAPIGTVTMFMNLVGTPPTEAIVDIQVTDYDIVLAMDTTTEIHASASVDKLLQPLVVRMSVPRAFILGFAIDGFDQTFQTVTMIAPTSGAETGPEAAAEAFPEIDITQVVAGSAVGAGLGYPIEITESGNLVPRWFRIISLNGDSLTASVQSGAPFVPTLALPQVNVQLPLTAFAEQGIEIPADVTGVVHLIPPNSVAGGSALAIVRSQNTDPDPSQHYIVRIDVLQGPLGQAHAAADLQALNQPVTVVLDPPNAITEHGATVLATILPSKIVMRIAQAVGFAGNFALAIPDMEDLVILMTEPNAFSPVTAEPFSDPIDMYVVDGFVDDQPLPPGISRLKLKRSQTPDAQPLTLAEREIALNEYDGILYSRDGAGQVRATPYVGFGRGRFVPAGGADGQVLGVDLVWKNPPTGEGSSRLLVPQPATRILLANTFTFAGESLLESVGAGQFPVHFRPFFLPKTTRFLKIGAKQIGGNMANAQAVHLRALFGIAGWDPVMEEVTTTLFHGHVDVLDGSGNALREINIDVTLGVGWYVSMFGAHNLDIATGQPLEPVATWEAWKGGVSIGADFYPQGEPVGILSIGADLSAPPAITQFATVQAGDISDHTFVQAVTA